MIPICVLFSAPVNVPACMKENSFTPDINFFQICCADPAFRPVQITQHYTVQICERIQIQLRQIETIRITMERAVEVRSRIGHHFDLADVELSSLGVALP